MNKYRPSNGTEGECFMAEYCDHCIHERWTHRMEEDRQEDKCDILSRSFCFDIDDPEYPIEWTYDEKGNPTCTNYQHWDWGDDDNPNEPPEKPIEPGPNQLSLFPLYHEDMFKEKQTHEQTPI